MDVHIQGIYSCQSLQLTSFALFLALDKDNSGKTITFLIFFVNLQQQYRKYIINEQVY